ncbi:hypothetical protein AB0J57_00405 [Streptomyces sp. NPDC049837]|uniref:hypothetical protein n=1 Tax=Streptomyces sp. NPDC049837 TaxID=3155277 RepID=UPI0034183BE8
MIPFVAHMIVSLGVHLLLNARGKRQVGWEFAGASNGETEVELAAVERIGVFANSSRARIKVERTLSRQWRRSVAWDVKAAVEKAAKAKLPVAEAEVKASLELHRGTETTEQFTASQRFEVEIEPRSEVEILVHWYRQIQTGTLSLTKSVTPDSSHPALLMVPFREVTGLTADVCSRDVQRLR